MLSISAAQADLAGRDGLALVWLFVLTTYSDRDAGTVEAVHYFSRGIPARYKWAAGAAQDFADVVLSASGLELTVDHLPDPRVSSARRQRLTLTLANDVIDGAGLWSTLSARNLAFARLEVATLVVERNRFAPGTASWDLTDFAGTEHVHRFRGELTGIDGAGDEEGIELSFESEEPAVDWPECGNPADADPKDLGRRYAVPFGRAKGVPCVNRKVGAATTLSDVISSAVTGNLKVTSTAGLPLAGSFTLSIDSERVTATRVDATTVNISARAQGGTLASAHQRGAPVLEILSSVVVVVAGVPCVAVDALYVVNPATREPVLVPSTLYSVNLDDRATDPGRRLTTVSFTQANLEALIDSLAASGSEPAYDEVPFNRSTLEVVAGSGWADLLIASTTPGIRLDGRGSAAGNLTKGLFTIDLAAIPTALLNREIVRCRVKGLFNGEGDTVNDINPNARTNLAGDVNWDNWGPLGVDINETLDYVFLTGAQESGVALATNWITPNSPKTGADLVDCSARFYFDAPTSPATGYASDNFAFVFGGGGLVVEVEFAPSRTGSLGAAAFGLGLVFSADVQGVAVPWEFSGGYGFDEGSSWSTAGGGTQSDQGDVQRLTAGALAMIGDPAGACDDDTLWTVNAAAKANEATIKTQGTGSIKITPNASGSDAYIERNFTANENWTGKAIAIDLRPEGSTHLSAGDGVQVRFEDAGGDWRRWDFGTADGLVIGSFVTLIIDPTVGWDDSSGTFTITTIDRIRVKCNQYGPGGSTANILYVDNIRLIDLVAPAVMQRNATAAAVDLTGSSSRYRTRIRGVNVGAIASAKVIFSNTAGSGTTPPAAYRTVTIPGAELAEGKWLDVEKVATDTGSPGVSNVETVRVELVRGKGSAATPYVEFDHIAGATATAAVGWDGATPGALLELGPDAIRYFVGELARQGSQNVSGVPTAKTNLAGVVFAGTFDSLGDSFASVLARLSFETRTNVLTRPSSSGLVFELSNSSAAGAYPAAAVTLSELRHVRESSRPALATPSAFRAHYAPALADGDTLGLDERAFRGLLSADASASDVAAKASTTALAAIAAKVGARAADPNYLLFAQAQATAADVFGFYVAESIRTPARRWRLRVPIGDGYALLPFDVVGFRPRWLGADVKARLVRTLFPLDEASIELDAVEVL